jgi:2'-5' RNA ligase
MRVYVALPLPEIFKTELKQRLLPLRKENHEYHWVNDAEDLHIMIANPILFKSNMNEVHAVPGELDACGAYYVQKAVKEGVADFRPIRIRSPGLFLCFFYQDRIGQYPVSSKSRYLFGCRQKDGSRWGGVDCAALKFMDGVKEMAALADNIDSALMSIGKATGNTFHERIKRPFIPYVVVVRRGRPRNPIVLQSKGRYFRDMTLNPPIECVLDKVTVYMSDKQSSGNIWTVQKTFRL